MPWWSSHHPQGGPESLFPPFLLDSPFLYPGKHGQIWCVCHQATGWVLGSQRTGCHWCPALHWPLQEFQPLVGKRKREKSMNNPHSSNLALLHHLRDKKKPVFVLASIINHQTRKTSPHGRLSALAQRPSTVLPWWPYLPCLYLFPSSIHDDPH